MKDLQTKRLHLRKVKASDAARIFNCWASDEEVTKYLTWNAHKSIESLKPLIDIWLEEYKEENCYRYGIELIGSNDLIGMIDVVNYNNGVPAIGYVLGKKYWHNGYMTEALTAMTDYLLDEGYTEIYIQADERNIGSNRVIEKCGYKFLHTKNEPRSAFKPEIVTLNCYHKTM